MKKTTAIATILSMAMALTACSSTSTSTSASTDATTSTTTDVSTEKMSIVASSFYEYDWTREVLGENADNFELSLLMNNGVDLHSYEPSVQDIALISSSDLFIYNGGESDTWVDDIISQPLNEELVALCVTQTLGDAVLAEVAVEGMEAEEHDHDHDDETTEEDHDHDDEATEEEHDHDDEATEEEHDHDDETTEEDHDHDEEVAEEEHVHEEGEECTDDCCTDTEDGHSDEHVWLSLKNAIVVCQAIADEISAIDPENAAVYQENAANYIAELEALDGEYVTMVESAARDTLIFGDRFPFLYMMNDYGVNYYAAFQGCSAETEASFETIVFLAEKVDEYDVNYLMIIDNGLVELATTIASNSQKQDCEILTLNSMQSITQELIDDGTTYYSIMSENLEVLTLALSE